MAILETPEHHRRERGSSYARHSSSDRVGPREPLRVPAMVGRRRTERTDHVVTWAPRTRPGSLLAEDHVGFIVGRIHRLACDGADLEAAITELIHQAGSSIEVLAAVLSRCSRQPQSDENWARAVAMVTAAMRTRLFRANPAVRIEIRYP